MFLYVFNVLRLSHTTLSLVFIYADCTMKLKVTDAQNISRNQAIDFLFLLLPVFKAAITWVLSIINSAVLFSHILPHRCTPARIGHNSVWQPPSAPPDWIMRALLLNCGANYNHQRRSNLNLSLSLTL